MKIEVVPDPGWLGRVLGRVALEARVYEWLGTYPEPKDLRRVIALIDGMKPVRERSTGEQK